MCRDAENQILKLGPEESSEPEIWFELSPGFGGFGLEHPLE